MDDVWRILVTMGMTRRLIVAIGSDQLV